MATDLLALDDKGKFEITDENKFNNWLNSPKLKHKNKLDYYNDCVQLVMEKFNDKDPFTIYYHLKYLYWTKYETITEFEEDIRKKINYINDIDELFEERI